MSNDNSEKRILSVCAIHQDGKYWPFIRLQGRWLQRLGFEAGDKIEVEGSHGLLLIRLISNVPTDTKTREDIVHPKPAPLPFHGMHEHTRNHTL